MNSLFDGTRGPFSKSLSLHRIPPWCPGRWNWCHMGELFSPRDKVVLLQRALAGTWAWVWWGDAGRGDLPGQGKHGDRGWSLKLLEVGPEGFLGTLKLNSWPQFATVALTNDITTTMATSVYLAPIEFWHSGRDFTHIMSPNLAKTVWDRCFDITTL